MATVIPIPLRTLTDSNQTTNFTLPQGTTDVSLVLDRTAGSNPLDADPATSIALDVYTSTDGGATWLLELSTVFAGGPLVRHGVPLTSVAAGIHDLDPNRTHVRTHVVVTGTVSFSGTLTLS